MYICMDCPRCGTVMDNGPLGVTDEHDDYPVVPVNMVDLAGFRCSNCGSMHWTGEVTIQRSLMC